MMHAVTDNLRELAHMPGLKAALALLVAALFDAVGHPHSEAKALLLLLILDLGLGMFRSWRAGNFRPRRTIAGAFKFFRYWLAVAVFVQVDLAIKKAFPALPLSTGDIFIAYLAINEAFSIVDHLAFFGMPVPEVFLRRLRAYREDVLAGKWNGVDRRQLDGVCPAGCEERRQGEAKEEGGE